MNYEIIWTIVSAVLILVGAIGTVAPFLPGPPLVLGGLILYGVVTDFENFSGWVLGVFIILTILTFVLDFFAPALGVRSSRKGAIGALLGTVLGVVLLGPIGIVLGPLIGAFIGELLATRNTQTAAHAAWRAFLAFLIGTAIKLGVVFAIAGYFIYLVFAGN